MEKLTEDEVYDTNAEVVIENEDKLSINITIEQIEELDERQCEIVAQKVSVALEKYENILMNCEELVLTEEQYECRGFDRDEYNRLRKLEKAIYSHIRRLRKVKKESGFLANIPTICVILFFIVLLLTIFPVNPYFPVIILSSILSYDIFGFMDSTSWIKIFYFGYLGLIFSVELIMFIVFLIKFIRGKDNKHMFKYSAIIFITNILFALPGIIYFLSIINKQ